MSPTPDTTFERPAVRQRRRPATGTRAAALAAASLLAATLVFSACDSPAAPPGASLVVTEVRGDALPAPDPSRTWKYRLPSVDADSITRALLRAGIPLAEAWEPLEDACMDPIGPRYTVVLTRPDGRMAGLGFEPGSGIRACTFRVRLYVPQK
jgi:hypothetical protein